MKSCSITRTAVGAGLVASFMLLQGCSYFGWESKPEDPPPVIPTPDIPEPVKDPVVEIKPVAATTPYTIVKGDTISEVAVRYGLRWQDVLAVNPGVSPKRLRIGQVIQLPGQVDLSRHVAPVRKYTAPKATAPKTSAPKISKAVSGPGTLYVVKSGDTLGGIAYRHGVKVDAIRKANNLTGDMIRLNQKLTIPGAKKSPAKVATETVKKPEPTNPEVVPAPVADTNSTTGTTENLVTPPPAPITDDPVVTTPPVPEPAANTQTYTVKEGEDLYAVAIRWGVSPSDLKALNNLTTTDLKAGMVLQIPASAQ